MITGEILATLGLAHAYWVSEINGALHCLVISSPDANKVYQQMEGSVFFAVEVLLF
jgi:hypothetical protein